MLGHAQYDLTGFSAIDNLTTIHSNIVAIFLYWNKFQYKENGNAEVFMNEGGAGTAKGTTFV